ncbi:hypothetical protein WL29_11985 [Burkholderia ubonensis]|uniref:Nucleotidyltransferase family protein n=1 Tax=Burkholderia ubonensis TaxID=101571 RepID=A0A106XXY2_9BURK|nr:hypothetical protein WL29_11985 [Burkholderia ubonensis]KWC54833.1 hypothetical protein WL54_26505 [Burkholderia ubonensis]
MAASNRKWDFRYTLLTILLGAVIAFLGFMGPDKIMAALYIREVAAGVKADAPASSAKQLAQSQTSAGAEVEGRHDGDGAAAQEKLRWDFWLNAAVEALFVISILNLIYRWKEDSTAHFQGVVRLTQYINWLDELTFLGTVDHDVALVKDIRSRYQGIVEMLPPNDDKDYKRAKETLGERPDTNETRKDARDEPSLKHTLVLDAAQSSPVILTVLRAMEATDPRLWLGGGVIRNCVWDELTGRSTMIDDFDIVYFDASNIDPAKDKEIEQAIQDKLVSSLRVSVKNQARMHLVTGEPPRLSLEDAIANWPETATAIAVQRKLGQLVLMAPVGLDDLLNLIVRPTSYHASHPESFDRRKGLKAWTAHWPELTVKSS